MFKRLRDGLLGRTQPDEQQIAPETETTPETDELDETEIETAAVADAEDEVADSAAPAEPPTDVVAQPDEELPALDDTVDDDTVAGDSVADDTDYDDGDDLTVAHRADRPR